MTTMTTIISILKKLKKDGIKQIRVEGVECNIDDYIKELKNKPGQYAFGRVSDERRYIEVYDESEIYYIDF